MAKIEMNEYALFYKPYIQELLDNDKDLIENLNDSLIQFEKLLMHLDTKK